MKRPHHTLNSLKRRIQRVIHSPSLQVAFTVPVLIQILAAVGTVGYLSFWNGQQAVTVLASQLRSEISARIQGELESYFGDPHALNRLNATAFSNGDIDIAQATRGEHLLFQQMKIHPTIALAYCGSASSGEFFGIFRDPETGRLELSYSNPNTNFFRRNYSLDVRGNRQHFLSQADQSYDSRLRPWFDAALDAEGPAWTDVYIAFTTELPNVTASLPVYDRRDRRLLGVCAADVVLPEEFRSFLQQLEIGQSGQAFVVDRQGNLISSSTEEPLVTLQGRNPHFLAATQSKNPQVRKSADYLLEHFGSFDHIQQNQQLIFALDGQRQFLEVLPFRDGVGLDWLIVVVVPESEFMGQITLNTQITVLLCILALMGSLAIGMLLARRLTSPILQLNAAVKEIAEGRLYQRVAIERSDELGELADSVNSMAGQIQQSFERLNEQRHAFSRFFPPEYLRFLNKQNVTEVKLGDHVSQEMTVMFSDIRGFTRMAEEMKAQGTFNFINTYLQRISPTVRNHKGFVVKFMGDGMMAIFPDSVEDAIDSAIAQFRQVEAYNQQVAATGEALTIEIGIGLHTGHVMAGMVGEPDRIQPDAISDTVNLAARLEGLSKVYGAALVISEAVMIRIRARDRYQIRFLDSVIVKGRTQPIGIYEVLDAEPDESRSYKLKTLPAFEAGIEAYRSREFATAKDYFTTVRDHHPQDRTARLYQQRIEDILNEGVPENWNGAWTFQRKR